MRFLGTALKIHRILQLTLHGCNKGCFIRSHGVGTMLLSNVTENIFQIIRNQTSEIFIFSDLCHFQRPQMQIIFIQKRRLLWEEEERQNRKSKSKQVKTAK